MMTSAERRAFDEEAFAQFPRQTAAPENCTDTEQLDLERLAHLLRSLDDMSPADVALELADLGIPVLATVPGEKAPLLTVGHIDGVDPTTGERQSPPCSACKLAGLRPARDHGATTDVDVIRRYWTAHPDAGVGMKDHPRLVRADGDFADGGELRKARKLIGWGQPDGEPEPFTAPTPGGQYRRRIIHLLPDGVPAPGGGTKVLGVGLYCASGYTLVKGRHPNGGEYGAFRGDSITPLPEALAGNLRRRSDHGTAEHTASNTEVEEFLDRHTGTERLELLARRRKSLSNAKPGDRHELAVGMLAGCFREAIAGYYPTRLVHDTVRDALRSAGWTRERFGKEWADLVAWGVGQVRDLDPNLVRAELTADTYRHALEQLEDRYDPAYIDSIDDEAPRDLTTAEIDARLAAIEERVAGQPTAPERAALDIVDWGELFAGITHEDPIVDGVALRGRWTAHAAPGKAGKSTYTIHIAIAVQRGVDPFDGTLCEPVVVLYLDAEMGRVDMYERLDDLDIKPAELSRLHYTDIVPKLDTIEGSSKLLHDVERLGVGLVIIDGINGAVGGAENDDTTPPGGSSTTSPSPH